MNDLMHKNRLRIPTDLKEEEQDLLNVISELIQKAEENKVISFFSSILDLDNELDEKKERIAKLREKLSLLHNANWDVLRSYCVPFGIKKEDYLQRDINASIDSRVQQKVSFVVQQRKIKAHLQNDRQSEILKHHLRRPDVIQMFTPILRYNKDLFQKKWFLVGGENENAYRNIATACEHVPPDSCLFIMEGVYKDEYLVIDKPLHLIGLGNREKIVISNSKEDALLFKRTHGSIYNLSLRYTGQEAGKYALDIVHSDVYLRSCSVQSANTTGIGVRFRSDATIRDTSITNCGENGVFVTPKAKLSMFDSTFSDIQKEAICCFSFTACLLKDNQIDKGESEGIAIYVEDNDADYAKEIVLIQQTNAFSKNTRRDICVLSLDSFHY